MKTCRVCGEKKAVKKPYVCVGCVNVKHFKCFCCDQKFSYVELAARNLEIGSRYKCMRLRMQRSNCSFCQKPSCLLANYNQQCLRCTNKDNACVKLEAVEKQLLIEYDQKVNYAQQIKAHELNVQSLFAKLHQIKDPIDERDILVAGFNGLLKQLENAYSRLNYAEQQAVNSNLAIERQKAQIISLQADINKLHNVYTCYNAARTFMLCGLQKEVLHYIPKQIQRVIAMHILREFFILGV